MSRAAMTPTDRTDTIQRLVRSDRRTRAQIAEALGVSRWTLRSWMEGSRVPPEPIVKLMRMIHRPAD